MVVADDIMQIKELDIKREKGYLYFLKTSEQGNLIVCKAKMGRSKKGDVENGK